MVETYKGGKIPKVMGGMNRNAIQNKDSTLCTCYCQAGRPLCERCLWYTGLGWDLKVTRYGLRNRLLRETYQPKARSPRPSGTPGRRVPSTAGMQWVRVLCFEWPCSLLLGQVRAPLHWDSTWPGTEQQDSGFSHCTWEPESPGKLGWPFLPAEETSGVIGSWQREEPSVPCGLLSR